MCEVYRYQVSGKSKALLSVTRGGEREREREKEKKKTKEKRLIRRLNQQRGSVERDQLKNIINDYIVLLNYIINISNINKKARTFGH